MSSQDDLRQELAQRYGAPPPWRRALLRVGAVLVCAVFAGWLGWTIWGHSTPRVTSELQSFSILDEHTAEARLLVDLADPQVEASCKLRAYAADHNVVGEHTFSPDPSRRLQVAQVRTERRATSVESLGCTAPGQPRPR